jgi:hypothetical protein
VGEADGGEFGPKACVTKVRKGNGGVKPDLKSREAPVRSVHCSSSPNSKLLADELREAVFRP